MTRVLIVDDEFDGLEAIGMLLEMKGYEVGCASNGKEALHAAKKSRPDIVITDWMMPWMDGVEMCQQFKRDEDLRRIPIVMVSAAVCEPAEVGEEFAAFLAKPYVLDELIELIERHSRT